MPNYKPLTPEQLEIWKGLYRDYYPAFVRRSNPDCKPLKLVYLLWELIEAGVPVEALEGAARERLETPPPKRLLPTTGTSKSNGSGLVAVDKPDPLARTTYTLRPDQLSRLTKRSGRSDDCP